MHAVIAICALSVSLSLMFKFLAEAVQSIAYAEQVEAQTKKFKKEHRIE